MADFFAHLNYVNIAKFWLAAGAGWALLEAARTVHGHFAQRLWGSAPGKGHRNLRDDADSKGGGTLAGG